MEKENDQQRNGAEHPPLSPSPEPSSDAVTKTRDTQPDGQQATYQAEKLP